MRRLLAALLALASLPFLAQVGYAARARTTTTLVAEAVVVDAGAPVQLVGRLSSKQRGCRRRQTVQLLEGTSVVAEGRTNRKGRITFEPVVDAPTSFRARFRGSKECRSSMSPQVTVDVFETPPPMLEGPPATPVAAAIPDAPFPNPQPSDFVFSEAAGIEMSTREVVVRFAPGTTVEQGNSLLSDIGGAVVGGNPDAGWVLVRLAQDRSEDEFLALLDSLDAEARVDMASPEVVLETDRVPGPNRVVDPAGPATTQMWTWGDIGGGQWGIEAIRAPQAWNLIDELSRTQVGRSDVGIIDSGFDVRHADLDGKFTLETFGGRNPNPLRSTEQSHGTGTAGIVTARYHNYQYIDGVAPFPTDPDNERRFTGGVVGLSFNRGRTNALEEAMCRGLGYVGQECKGLAFATRIADDLLRLRKAHPEVKIFNSSIGFNFDDCAPQLSMTWRAAGITGTDAQKERARQVIRATGRLFGVTMPSITSPEAILLFSSAGNESDHRGGLFPIARTDCPPRRDFTGDGRPDPYPVYPDPGPVHIPAVWTSPMCHAAGEMSGILCVEATRNAQENGIAQPLADFSNVGGHLAAPGQGLSTLAPVNAGSVAFPVKGTSFASPLVAGTAAWIHAFGTRNPRGPTPAAPMGLDELAAHLIAYSRPSAAFGDEALDTNYTRAPVVDMFFAVMGLDSTAGNDLLHKALVDVDDGSTLDGNARLDRDDEDLDGDTEELYPFDIATPDKARGDGRIDMKDFRAFRDALLDELVRQGELRLEQISLDGPSPHFKRDINLDGCVKASLPRPPHPDPPIPPARRCSGAAFVGVSGNTRFVEEFFQRYDFNGDGRLNGFRAIPLVDELAPFKGDPILSCAGAAPDPLCKRDIDVLAAGNLWQEEREGVGIGVESEDPCERGGWQPTTNLLADKYGPTGRIPAPDNVIDHIFSADLHFEIAADPTGDMDQVFIDVDSRLPDDDDVDNDGDGRIDDEFEKSWSKCLEIGPQGGKTLLTVPLFTGDVRVTVLGIDHDLDAEGNYTDDPYGFARRSLLKYGQDVVFEAPRN